MQKNKMLTRLVLMLSVLMFMLPCASVSAREFSDVPITATYYTAVDKLSNLGVIQGREDGNFAPEAQTTRAEFCAFLARANGYNDAYYQMNAIPFPDVSSDYWANKYISYCYESGFINGMLDGTFAPADPVTYEQVVKMVVCSSGTGDESLRGVGPYWYSGYIAVAEKYNLLEDTKKTIGKDANRAFVAQMVYNALSFINGGEVDAPDSGVDASDMSNDSAYPTADPDDEKISVDLSDEDLFESTPKPSLAPTAVPTAKPTAKPTPKPTAYPVIPTSKPQTGSENPGNPGNPGNSGGKVIVVDAGHNYSSVDTGATGNGLREQDITFYIAEKVKPLLEQHGFEVVMTRNKITDNCSTTSTADSLAYRYNLANRVSADLFVSIHCNAGGGVGSETYCYYGNEEGKRLSSYIQNYMVSSLGTTNRGVKEAGFAVLRNTNMTSVLVETAFIDSASDAAKLADSYCQQLFADSIARGICDYYGVSY